ncbi:MAG: peptidoglycan DD-metalloendopeptidase family protein [Chloroflexota bacterium]|nr:peptidoglycan DD-metalloendopeptidase family protein [Chloroflexota bacterium]MDE3193457.1 peptidoglycan DD-metalloendopeptidase family protein [Chloroflexota bacterium]
MALHLRSAGSFVLRLRAHILVDVAVVSLVLALPLSLQGSPTANAVEPAPASASRATVLRASTVSRSATISAVADPLTSVAADVRPIVHYHLGPSDSLESIANYFKITPEVIAYSNGITDPTLKNQQGREILIPPGQGALYTVQTGDTVESVAAGFKVDPKAIMDYNRLYFEPEHFAPGQLIYVPGATVPAIAWVAADPNEADAPSVLARPAPAQLASNGILGWPVVNPVITQYFWALHSGVDLAVPYGSPIYAAADGVVEYSGWVAVGGLCVQIRHADGIETGYYHTSVVFVTAGQKVQKGQLIARVGLTGVTTGPHVHFEVKKNGVFQNPLAYLK